MKGLGLVELTAYGTRKPVALNPTVIEAIVESPEGATIYTAGGNVIGVAETCAEVCAAVKECFGVRPDPVQRGKK